MFKKAVFPGKYIQGVGAIRELPALIDLPGKCMGRGVCILGCKQQALTYEIVRPLEFIPAESPFRYETVNVR